MNTQILLGIHCNFPVTYKFLIIIVCSVFFCHSHYIFRCKEEVLWKMWFVSKMKLNGILLNFRDYTKSTRSPKRKDTRKSGDESKRRASRSSSDGAPSPNTLDDLLLSSKPLLSAGVKASSLFNRYDKQEINVISIHSKAKKLRYGVSSALYTGHTCVETLSADHPSPLFSVYSSHC